METTDPRRASKLRRKVVFVAEIGRNIETVTASWIARDQTRLRPIGHIVSWPCFGWFDEAWVTRILHHMKLGERMPSKGARLLPVCQDAHEQCLGTRLEIVREKISMGKHDSFGGQR